MAEDEIARTYLSVFERGILAHPRSAQRMIGPSEIGQACEIRLLRKLAQQDEPRRNEVAWKPAVGTALHSQAEVWFGDENDRIGWERWKTEHRVLVGEIAGQPVWGTSDLFDTAARTVYDHKFVGMSRLRAYRSKGPGQQYRTQAHLYGLGFWRAGMAPREVAICFLPRDGELGQAYVWHEAWDPALALGALVRCERLLAEVAEVGVEAACARRQPCDDAFCPWCSPGKRAERAAARAGAGGFFGD